MKLTEDLLQKKYLSLFYRLVKDGELVDVPEDAKERKELLKLLHIADSKIDNFKAFLESKQRRYGEGFDEWYKYLKITDLDDYDLMQYELPNKVTEINYGCEFELMKELFKSAETFIDSSKHLVAGDEVIARYRFWQGGIIVEFAFRKGMPVTDARKKVMDAHKVFIKEAKSAVDKFNKANSIYHLQWTSSATPVLAFEEEIDGKLYTGTSVSLTASVDLYRVDKQPVEKDYSYKLFRIITAEKSVPVV